MFAGLLQHLLLTLRLNFRSWQPLVYGYLVPVFFLFAFGSIFKTVPPLYRELGQLLTITTLGGACFGLPTSMVAERERGVWRRYRLLPAATTGIIFSTMVARFVLVLSAAALQILLAKVFYGMPMPAHPVQLLIAFVFVCFAFLGMGLVIAMIADNVPAVQALGQAIFLPMIIIGGVGVPLRTLPVWGQHVAAFLPGRYAVDAMQGCVNGEGLKGMGFQLVSLTVIGAAACFAGSRLFRWDMGQRLGTPARGWALMSIVAWAGVGIAAEVRGVRPFASTTGGNELLTAMRSDRVNQQASMASSTGTSTGPSTALSTAPSVVSATQPQSRPSAVEAAVTTGHLAIETSSTTQATAASQPSPVDWRLMTDADANRITYDDLEPDDSTVTPIAKSLENLPEDQKGAMDDLAGKLTDWKPGQDPSVLTRVRNLLAVAAIPDILQDPNEANVPLVVFQELKDSVPKDQLIKALTWIAMKPDDGSYPTRVQELGFDAQLPEDAIRERAVAYGRKLLGRLLGKLPRN